MEHEIDKFIEYLEYEKKYSIHTVKNYELDLIEFNEFLIENNIKNIDYKVIRNYLNIMYEKKYKTKSICRKISSLRSFFKFEMKEKNIKENPMVLVTNPKQEKRLPHFLYYKELEELLSIPDKKSIYGARDSLILELLYSTGIRVSELVNIKIEDINFNERTIRILGKGNKERIVIYGTICKEKLNNYLKISRDKLLKYPCNYLILNKNGRKITTRGIELIVDKTVKNSQLKDKISPHVLRHTFATHMLNEGADLKTVQELLGHANLAATGIYTHVSNEHLRNVYLNAHPRARKE